MTLLNRMGVALANLVVQLTGADPMNLGRWGKYDIPRLPLTLGQHRTARQ